MLGGDHLDLDSIRHGHRRENEFDLGYDSDSEHAPSSWLAHRLFSPYLPSPFLPLTSLVSVSAIAQAGGLFSLHGHVGRTYLIDCKNA